ncbi:MAG: tRNA (adenosine(37)-N6)-threonylcarbamoyltransferase complex ATPase subunit type 1 TsaE [Bacteroidota bacterium]
MEWIYKLHHVKLTAEQFWKVIGNAKVLAFHGAMGSGKTTFIHALCDVKGVKDVVGSPTFSIINEYEYWENSTVKKIFHIDLYRLKDEYEATQAGVEDCLYSGQICLLEWPEKISSRLPADCVHIYIEFVDEQTRKLRIEDN